MLVQKHLVGCLCVAVLTLSLMGCTADIRDYCEAMVECEGGNDADEDACIESWRGEREAAKEYDCRDEFDDLMSCMVAEGECNRSDHYATGEACWDDRAELEECVAAASDLDRDEG